MTADRFPWHRGQVLTLDLFYLDAATIFTRSPSGVIWLVLGGEPG